MKTLLKTFEDALKTFFALLHCAPPPSPSNPIIFFLSLMCRFGYIMVFGPLITELDETKAQQHKTCNRSVYMCLFVIFSCGPVLDAVVS